MQNIQDLQEKIFFESKNIIGILDKINNVDELLSKQDLIDQLAERISFLKLLKSKVEYYQKDDLQFSQAFSNHSLAESISESQDFSHEVMEEEAIFNNELNEIGKAETHLPNNVMEEEAIFNNQLNEIEENEFHENLISLAEEEKIVENAEENTVHEDLDTHITEEESVFNDQLDEIEEEDANEEVSEVLSFVDEERILENSVPEEDNIEEEIFDQKVTEEEAIFNNQLNEIDEFENEISDESVSDSFEEEEQIQNNYESVKITDDSSEKIPSMFESDEPEDEILIEESENETVSDDFKYDEDGIITENSNVESILTEIKKDTETEIEISENTLTNEDSDRRKIVDIDRPSSDIEKEKPASDESFENLEAYQQEKKIRLANIKGLKTIQTLFDDDPLAREIPQDKPAPVVKEDSGSILKTNIPTEYMEAEKQKPEFRLDLNDRMAFTKLLFGGSQTDLNQAVAELNRCRNLEEAKEYLSELYYDRKWNKVDEYAQRLWILVENKFL